MKQSVPISIIIPIRNEAANLERCIRSVSWADEIYVVDYNQHQPIPQTIETYFQNGQFEQDISGRCAN